MNKEKDPSDEKEPISKEIIDEVLKTTKLKAKGDMTVVNNKDVKEDIAATQTVELPKKKVYVLPEEQKIFMIDGEQYYVCYVNKGQKRFSASPVGCSQ